MKIPSFRFNEDGYYFAITFNYSNLWLYVAVAIPYPWYGKYAPINRDVEPVVKWHIRHKVIDFVIRKSK